MSKVMQRIYLVNGRKQGGIDLPSGWKEVAWERFDYIECSIFEKQADKLTEVDKRLVEDYGEIPQGWINPL